MQFIPYLNFNGNCAEAFAFYARLFGGTIVHQSTFGETPGFEQMPEAGKNLIMHAHLQIKDQALMASDATDNCGGGGYQQAQGMWISIGVDDEPLMSDDGQVYTTIGFAILAALGLEPWMFPLALAIVITVLVIVTQLRERRINREAAENTADNITEN